MRRTWTLLCIICSLSATARANTNPSRINEAVVEATELLNSIGVQNLCHPTSTDFSPSLPLCDGERKRRLNEEGIPKKKWETIGSIVGALVCVFVVATASGLTVGLLPLDPLMLLVKMRAGATEDEKKQAASLLSVLRKRHLLLVSLLLLATLSSEALPIFLDDLMPGFAAVLVAVVLVLFFGKIAPSALCTGPNQIAIVSKFVPLVKFIMWLVYPVAYPIAKLLDAILDDEHEGGDDDDMVVTSGKSRYDRTELAALIRIQYEESENAKQRRMSKKIQSEADRKPNCVLDQEVHRRPGLDKQFDKSIRSLKAELMSGEQTESVRMHKRHESIHIDEVSMMEGALQMKTKVAMDIYTPLHKVFCIPFDWNLNEKNVIRIYSSGYSRVPVYDKQEGKATDRSAIRGILMTRQLIMVNSKEDWSVSNLPLNVPMCVSPKMNLVDLMNLFQTGGKGGKGGHMALVCARPEVGNSALDEMEAVPEAAGLMGIITLEDVLEALLQEQIYDEMDAAGRMGGPEEIEVMDDEYHLV